jgi:flagellar protein FliL
MSKSEETAAVEAPKKSKKMLIIIVLAVVLLGGGGAGAYFFLKGDPAEAAPEKGSVVTIEDALTINLADSHYLKMGFAIQQTTEGAEELDTAEALDIAIDTYTGMSLAELSNEKGRDTAKAKLLKGIEEAYNVDGKKIVMGIYFTQFVTQ